MKKKSLGQRALNRVGIATAAQIEQQMEEARADADRRVKEAYASGWDDGNDDPAQGQIAAGGQGYRIASGGVREPSISWEKNLDSAWQLLQANPLVDRMSEIHRDYIVGQGIEPKAADPDLQTIESDFWKDNSMPTYISELVRQWGDYGAQCVPAYVRQSDGRVRLGYIDPSLIEKVIAHPENARQMWAVVKKAEQNQDAWIPSVGIEVYKIVRKAEQIVVEEQSFELPETEDGESESVEFPSRIIEARWRNPNNGEDAEPENVSGKLATAEQSPRAPWETVMLKTFGLDDYSGDCFLIRKNADSNQPLGRSDHLQVADFCDQHDGAMWSLSVREQLANLVVGILRIAGNDDRVKEWQKKVNDWGKTTGTMLVVNESVLDFDLNSPVLNQTSSVSTTDAQRKLILGGEGIPDAWFTTPAGAHLATLTAQGDPTWRTLIHDQGLVQAWFVEMLEFVRDQAMIAGHYRPEPTTDEDGEEIPADTTVTLPMPEMTVRDVGALATALVSVIGAMSMAVDEGFASRDDGIDAVAKVLAELDVHPNVDELKDAALNDGQAALLGDGQPLFDPKAWQSTHAPLTTGATDPKKASEAWKEKEHPRDDSGQFKGTPGGGKKKKKKKPADDKPKKFTSKADADTWAKDEKGINPDVTTAESDALQAYKAEDFYDINSDLRDVGYSEIHDEKIAQIDSAIAKATLDSPVITYRGTDYELFEDDDDLTGGFIVDDAFTSTSLDLGMATTHAEGVTMEIKLPKGAHALYMDSRWQAGGIGSESELLLPRGSRFRVVSDDHDPDEYTRHLVVELVED